MKFKLRRYYLYYAGRVLAFILYLVPLRIGLRIGSLLGGLAFHIAIRYRHIAIENLKIAFGDTKTECEIEKIAKRAFQNLGKNAVELVNFPKINESNINSFVTIKNIERLNSALAKGMGVLIVTGHFGNWELLASTVTLNRYS